MWIRKSWPGTRKLDQVDDNEFDIPPYLTIQFMKLLEYLNWMCKKLMVEFMSGKFMVVKLIAKSHWLFMQLKSFLI